MKRSQNTEPLKEVIDRMLKEFRLERGMKVKRVEHAWRNIVGKLISSKTKSIYLDKEGVLKVKIESAIIKDELSYAKAKLIEQLNKSLQSDIVKDIKF